MVYDLNKLNDVKGKVRVVPVSDGVNFREIALPKVIVGGNAGVPEDIAEYPGAVLVNVPRLKMHALDLVTNAIKNVGIGLYPMEIGETEDTHDTRWRYSYPYAAIPGTKANIPHAVWVPDFDEQTGLPLRNKDGTYKCKEGSGNCASNATVCTCPSGVESLGVVNGTAVGASTSEQYPGVLGVNVQRERSVGDHVLRRV